MAKARHHVFGRRGAYARLGGHQSEMTGAPGDGEKYLEGCRCVKAAARDNTLRRLNQLLRQKK